MLYILIAIRLEEHELVTSFGEKYLDYRQQDGLPVANFPR